MPKNNILRIAVCDDMEKDRLQISGMTDQIIPAGSMGELELRFVAGEQSVVIPADSEIGRQTEWSRSVIEGNASMEEMRLFTEPSAHGMLRADSGMLNAMVVFDSHTVTFPSGEGYTIRTESSLPVAVTDQAENTVTYTVTVNYPASNPPAVDDEVPSDNAGTSSDAPLTGDSAPVARLSGMVCISTLAMGALWTERKRRQNAK